jgi:hypothetical protein
MFPVSEYPFRATTGKMTRVTRKAKSAFILKGITPLEKNGAIIIIELILIMMSRNTWKW